MEERFGGKRLWIGLGALGLVLLCLVACGLLTLAVLLPRPAVVAPQLGPAQMQAPAGEDGQDSAYGRPAATWVAGRGPLGFLAHGLELIVKVAFWSLLLMLLLGLARRLLWGPRHWCRPGWDESWPDRPHARWRAWHPHSMHHRGKPGTASEEDERGAPNAEYSGPQV